MRKRKTQGKNCKHALTLRLPPLPEDTLMSTCAGVIIYLALISLETGDWKFISTELPLNINELLNIQENGTNCDSMRHSKVFENIFAKPCKENEREAVVWHLYS